MMQLYFNGYWVPVLEVRYFTFSLLHLSHMISTRTPTGRGNPTKLMFVNFKIDLCWCKFLWQVEWPEYIYENLSMVSIRLLWSEPTVCMCIFPWGCCDQRYTHHCTLCVTPIIATSWKETLISTPYKKKKKLSL